jgi:hypothetical protein
MRMKTCKSCKYWNVSRKVDVNKMADCDFPDTMTAERFIKNGSGTSMEIEATAHDDSGLSVTLLTGENFGCTQHVEKL